MKANPHSMEPKAADTSLVARAVRPVTGFGFENLFAISQGFGSDDPAAPVIAEENAAPDADLVGSTTAVHADWAHKLISLPEFMPEPAPDLPKNFISNKTGTQHPVAGPSASAHWLPSEMLRSDIGMSLVDFPGTKSHFTWDLKTSVAHGQALSLEGLQVPRAADINGGINDPSEVHHDVFDPADSHKLSRIEVDEALLPQLAPTVLPMNEAATLTKAVPLPVTGTLQAEAASPTVTADVLPEDASEADPPAAKTSATSQRSAADLSPPSSTAALPGSRTASLEARALPAEELVAKPSAAPGSGTASLEARALPAEEPVAKLAVASSAKMALLEAGVSPAPIPAALATKAHSPQAHSPTKAGLTKIASPTKIGAMRDDQFRGEADSDIPGKVVLTAAGTSDHPNKELAQQAGAISLARASLDPSFSPQAPTRSPSLGATLDLRNNDWGNRLIGQIERMVTTGSQRILLSLRPKNLGEIQVMLDMRGDQTMVHIVTETSGAARLLLGAEDRLSQLLDQSGYRLSGFSAQEQGSGAHAGQQGQNGQSAPRRPRPGTSTAKHDDASEATPKSPYNSGRGKSSGINMLA
jgi:flagellar hook-length control protein FliK